MLPLQNRYFTCMIPNSSFKCKKFTSCNTLFKWRQWASTKLIVCRYGYKITLSFSCYLGSDAWQKLTNDQKYLGFGNFFYTYSARKNKNHRPVVVVCIFFFHYLKNGGEEEKTAVQMAMKAPVNNNNPRAFHVCGPRKVSSPDLGDLTSNWYVVMHSLIWIWDMTWHILYMHRTIVV